MAAEKIVNLSKAQKAAVLILSMDEKCTVEIFNHMRDDEIRKIGSALLNLSQIPSTKIDEVMTEFAEKMDASLVNSGDIKIEDGGKVAENLLSKSLSKGRSNQILSSLRDPSPNTDVGDFKDFIQQFTSLTIFNLIGREHPQVIAVGLAYVKRGVAKGVLEKFSEEERIDILSRMASISKIPKRSLAELRNYIVKKMNENPEESGLLKGAEESLEGDTEVDGLDGTIKILKGYKRDQSMEMVEKIEKLDLEVGIQVSKNMFTMEDLERADGGGIREIMRGITNDDMKVALKNASDSLKDKFFSNMSERARMILQEDMEVMGPLKVEEIEVAQQNIINVAKQLLKEEKLILAESDSDDD